MNGVTNWVVQRYTPLIFLGLAMTTVCSAGLGWAMGRAPLQVQLARLSAEHAAEKQQLAQNAFETLQAAQARGDALSAGLLTQQTKIDQLKTEARRAITQATTGKPCLNAPALRLLDSAPGLRIAGLSPATGGAAAAGEPVATDTNIAVWIVDAGAAFEGCRTRLDALIDWHAPKPNSVTP